MLLSRLLVLNRIVLSRPVAFSVRRAVSTLGRSGGIRARLVAMMSGAGMILSAVAYGSSQLKTLNAASGKTAQEKLAQTIEVVDRLYDENKMVEALAYLEKFSDSTEADILWRLARLCFKVGKYHVATAAEAKDMSEKAVRYIERALEADGKNFACHKWSGIIINWSSEFFGTRRKIERSFDVQEHFQRAIELNPQDPTSRHLMGQWCYGVASVPWYQKKIAAVVFATPPYSTFEEALRHFKEAEEIEPGFYSTNWLYIGKCYLQLGRVEEGGVWLKKAAAYISDVEEDIEAKKEAEQILKKLAIK